MPSLSQWYIKLSFGYLLMGFTFGALLLAHKGQPLHPALWNWLPAHIEWLLIGWVAQLTLGMAFWILPRFWKEPRRGNTTGAYVALVMLNAGIWLASLGPVYHLSPWLLVAGRLLEAGAAITFAHAVFPRVVGRDG
ncbi:MAG: hypothetical protein M9896_01360 [Candidatus Promineofilum sp.]|uniref:hypothetical protein n=1 Tax=Promineifilum sp. TaxID=2664178 RepID=UPI0024119BC6|nr:hypothetical protein [Promineifilum sp.]